MMDRGKTIEKKILPEYFRAVKDRVKTFELRKDDSDYQVGDILKLREWDGEKYTGNVQFRQITYILRDCPEYGLQPGFCILAIQGTMWEEELRRKPMADFLGRKWRLDGFMQTGKQFHTIPPFSILYHGESE
jgi:hypothetical protein